MLVVGLNYWPSYCPIYFWRDYRGEEIDRDLEVIRGFGVNSVRVFLLTRVFMGDGCGVREDALVLLRDFLDRCGKYGLRVYLTLLVGHMSGKNFGVVGGSIYCDDSIACLERFFYELASRLRDHQALEAYIIGNEVTVYEKPLDREKYRRLLRSLYNALKSADPVHKVTSGSGLFYPRHTGAEPETEAEILDYLAPHMYNYDIDAMRQSYAYIFKLKHCMSTGKPVIFEELGFSSHQYGEHGQLLFLRAILYSIVANGARGFMVWCYSDFSNEKTEPYNNHPYELGFGIFRSNRTPKPAAYIIKEIARLDKKLELSRYKPREDPIAILIPQYLYKDIEFVNKRIEKVDPGTTLKVLQQSFTMLKMAGYNPATINEDMLARALPNIKALIIPSIPILRATTWRTILEHVERGLIVYYSIAVSLKEPHHSPTHLWRELFGVEPVHTPGYIAPRTCDLRISLFGDEIIVPGIKTWPKHTPHIGLRIEPIDAEPIGHTEQGEPLIFRAKRGAGEAILVAEPLEYYLIEAPDANKTYKPYIIYKKLLNITPAVDRRYPPEIEAIECTRGRKRILYLINHSYSEAVIEAELEPIILHGRRIANKYAIEPRGVVLAEV